MCSGYLLLRVFVEFVSLALDGLFGKEVVK